MKSSFFEAMENLGKDLERSVSHVSHARKTHIKRICGLLPTWLAQVLEMTFNPFEKIIPVITKARHWGSTSMV